MLDFAPQRRELARRRRERLARRTQGLPLIRRIDPAFFVLLFAATLVLLFFWSVWVGAGWRAGLFDPPLVRPLPDDRILANVRSDLDERPLLAAAVHRGQLYVAQRGGQVHRYDPATELWTTERPFAGDPPAIGDLVDLRSGCGTIADRCADPRSLWAISAAGGLARLGGDGVWTAVFGESAFQDAAGYRPSTEDLTSAALSGDGRWLLFGTREHGVGLFDQKRRAWVEIGAEDLARLPSPTVSHLRWWTDRFWIGGPEGLAFLRPEDGGARIGVREDMGGSVEDLEAGDALWVLESRRCVNDPELACTKLSRLAAPELAVEVLVNETSRYPELDLEGLRVAQIQKTVQKAGDGNAEEEVLVLAGRAGLFTYDPGHHSWKRPVEEPVLAHHRDASGGLWAGTTSGVVYVAGGRLAARWTLPGERVRRLVPASGGGMMALTEGRNVFSLLAGGETRRVFAASSTSFDPRSFYEAVALEDGEVLFLSREGGILIHDVFKRSYRDVARGQVPGWLFDPTARFLAAGRRLFALLPPASPSGSMVTILTTDPDEMAAGDYDQPGRVPSPVVATAPWGGEGLAMIAGDGSAYLARKETLLRLTGVPARDLDALAWNDVALDSERLAVATEQGVRTYLLDERSFQDWTLRGTAVRELALPAAGGRSSSRAGRLRMRTADGRLARPDPADPFLIGGRSPWDVSGGGFTDARFEGGQLFLAGEGRVLAYDPERRRLSGSWELATQPSVRPAVRLAGVLGSGDRAEPVSWADGRVFVGGAALDPEAGRVTGLSLGERYLWTVREPDPGGPRYLKGYFKSRPFEPGLAKCLFRHASAGSGRPLDAREVRPRLVAVATTRGLRLYSRDTRSWYEVRWRGFPFASGEAGPGTSGDVLHQVGDLLAVATESGGRESLVFLSLEDVTLPDSCASRDVVDVEPDLVIEAQAVSFDEASGTAAWVLPDGTVRQWREGREETLLAPARGAPPPDKLKRVYRAGEKLVFTTGLSLAVYDLASHRWSQHLVVPPGEGADVLAGLDLAEPPAGTAGGSLTLTATTASGAVYVGAFDPAAPRGSLRLTEVLAPRERRSGSLGARPEDLIDVQWRLGKWAFILPDRLAVYDPENRRWEGGVPFPGPPDPGLSLRQAVGLDVLVKEGGREWWIEHDPLSRSAESARWARFRPGDDLASAVDEKARVWRLRPGGRVERCEPRAGEYACEVALAASSDPVVTLEAGPGGAGLRARRRSGAPEDLTGLSVELEPRLPPAVDVDWLALVRGGAEPVFRVATASGPRTFTRQEFLRGGRFLFEDVRAVSAAAPSLLHAATPHGVWTFHGPTLALARRSPATFQPAALGADVSAAHGRFFTPEASLLPPSGRLEPDPDPEHRVEVGSEIVFVERIRAATVEGRIRTPNGTISAFDEGGLVWDRRRGVAHHPRLGLVLLTGAGIHPLRIGTPLDSFDPGPNGRALAGGRLLSTPGGGLYFHDGSAGHLLTAEGWRRATGGAFDRTLVDTGFWSWSRRGGRLEVVLKEGEDLSLEPGPGGWEWSFDRLRDAAFHRGRLYFLTDADLEVTGENVGNGSLTKLHPAPPAGRLESLAPGPDALPELYAWPVGRDGRASRWNQGTEVFEPLAAAEDPRENRELVRYGPLRIALEHGRLVQELRVEDPSAPAAGRRPRWKRFRPTREGFPFDRVTAIGAVDGRLLVDSPAGLQVYPAGIDGAGLGDVETIYDLGDAEGAGRMGRPAADPRRFVVAAGRRCFEWRETLEPCRRSASLAERWRAESALWRFTESGGRARGFYKDAAGRLTETEVAVAGGRFPHDRLADLALCGDEAAGLWKNGWISLHHDLTLSLAGAAVSGELAAGHPRELTCVARGREIPGGHLEAGLYAAGDGGRYWRRQGDEWTVVTDPEESQAVAAAPLQQYARLRLARGPETRAGAFLYQYRSRAGKWIEIPWNAAEGRLAIDVIDDLRAVDGALWAIGPAGITALGTGEDGRLRLDPDDLTWIREPPCEITDFEVEGRRAVARCNHDSGRLFAGSLESGVDDGVFVPADGPDPFVEETFVTEAESGYWNWRLAGRRGGDPGRMEARLRGEPLGLAGGRFDFDHLTSIALDEPDRVELVSAVGGWYRQAGDGLHVRDLARPDLDGGLRAVEVTRLAVTRQAERQSERQSLCAETEPGTAFLIRDGAVQGSARECPEDLGSDAVWSYSRSDGRLRVRAPGIAGGWAERGLVQGRLTDQIALGLPVTSSGEKGPRHLVPTAAGVLRLEDDGSPTAAYAPEHDGLEPGAVPPVLYVDPEGRAVYVTETGVRDLESGELLSGPSFQVPEEASPTALEEEAGGLLRLRWRRGDERGWSLLRSDDYAAVGENVVPLDATSWGRYMRGRMGWTDASADLGLRLLHGGWQLFTREGNRSVELPWTRPFQPIAVLAKGPRLFVVEAGELSELRLDLGVEELFR